MQNANPAHISALQKGRIAKASLKKMVKGAKPAFHAAKRPKRRILSIDGGGIRAIVPAVLLAAMEERLQLLREDRHTRIIDCFDMLAGTSAGGILTALYLTPDPSQPDRPKYSAREVLELYLENGCESFTPANPDGTVSRTEKYSANILEQRLQHYMGADIHFGQLVKPGLITAYDLDGERPVCFESWNAGQEKLWQIVRATTAAPGLFKPAQFDELLDGRPLIDGSIFAPNPSLCAYTAAAGTMTNKKTADYSEEKPLILSLGTGKLVKNKEEKSGSWIRSMVQHLMSSSSVLVDQQLRQLLADPAQGLYCRWNPALPPHASAIDNANPEQMKILYQLASEYFERKMPEVDRLLARLLQ